HHTHRGRPGRRVCTMQFRSTRYVVASGANEANPRESLSADASRATETIYVLSYSNPHSLVDASAEGDGGSLATRAQMDVDFLGESRVLLRTTDGSNSVKYISRTTPKPYDGFNRVWPDPEILNMDLTGVGGLPRPRPFESKASNSWLFCKSIPDTQPW